MKIGILGGTFNPVHLGHLIMAQTVAKKFKLEQILFIPCAVPYHKKNIRLADARHRLKMVRLAVARTPHFAGSDIDLKRGGPSYSIDTIQKLKKAYPPRTRFYFIIGSDSLWELPLWYRIKDLTRTCQFVTIARSKYPLTGLKKLAARIGPAGAQKIKKNFLKHPVVNISSTGIRARRKKKRPISQLVPHRVEKYIIKHRLYQ